MAREHKLDRGSEGSRSEHGQTPSTQAVRREKAPQVDEDRRAPEEHPPRNGRRLIARLKLALRPFARLFAWGSGRAHHRSPGVTNSSNQTGKEEHPSKANVENGQARIGGKRGISPPVAGGAALLIFGVAGYVLLFSPGYRDDLWVGALLVSLPIMVAGGVEWCARRHAGKALRRQIAAERVDLEQERDASVLKCAELDRENHRLREYESFNRRLHANISELKKRLGEETGKLREKERKLAGYRSTYSHLGLDEEKVADLGQKLQELEGTVAQQNEELARLRDSLDTAQEHRESESRLRHELDLQVMGLQTERDLADRSKKAAIEQLESAQSKVHDLGEANKELLDGIEKVKGRLSDLLVLCERRLLGELERHYSVVDSMRRVQVSSDAAASTTALSPEGAGGIEFSLADEAASIESAPSCPGAQGAQPSEIGELASACERLRRKLGEAAESFDTRLDGLETEHLEALAVLKKEKQEDLEALQKRLDDESERHKSEAQELKNKYSSEIKGIRDRVESRVASIQSSHNDQVERMKQGFETQLARLWPQVHWDERVAEIRDVLAEELAADPPSDGARGFFGALHQLCVGFGDKDREPALAADTGVAFYKWLHKFPASRVQAWPETVAAWLNEHLEKCSLRPAALGESFEPRWHSSPRQNGRLCRVDSFAVLNRDAAQTVWKKANVEVE